MGNYFSFVNDASQASQIDDRYTTHVDANGNYRDMAQRKTQSETQSETLATERDSKASSTIKKKTFM